MYIKDPEIMVKFGGHAMAAGLTIHRHKYEDFCRLFEEAVTYFAENKELQNLKEIDLLKESKYLTLETAEMIQSSKFGDKDFHIHSFVGKFYIIEQRILKDAHLKLNEKDHQRF